MLLRILKLVGNEKNGRSRRRQLLGKVSRFIYSLSMQFLIKNIIFPLVTAKFIGDYCDIKG
jgi:hypothetical protein